MTDYNKMKLKELKEIGRNMGLLRVDLYNKRNKNELIERIKKGKQLSDRNKNDLLKQAQDEGILVNATMSKNTILQKLRNPKLTDLNDKSLREVAKERGVRLRGVMPRKGIIARLENPDHYYTIEGLKKVAEKNKIPVDKNIRKPDLIRILQNANLLTTTPDTIEDSNIGVKFDEDASLASIQARKQKACSAREDLINYRKYIKHIKLDFLTSRRLKQIQKTLEKKEKKAKEEHDRLFEPKETESALRNFTKVYRVSHNICPHKEFE